MSQRVANIEDDNYMIPIKPVRREKEDPDQMTSLVVVREYDEERDKLKVEEMEKLCDIGQKGKYSLVTDLLGDPICRIRHFPSHVMLVAEYGEEGEIVGVIRGCIKTVARGHYDYVKLGYILGLRVSPTHRRLGIGQRLVEELEKWFKQNGACYAYMATDRTNQASLNLFTQKCSYTKFRSLSVLVQPVHAHYKAICSIVTIVKIPPKLAEIIYRHVLARSEFFAKDIDTILSNKLNLGTFMAIPKTSLHKWDPTKGVSNLPSEFAILSVWNTKEVFKLQLKGVSKITYGCCMGTRLLDSWFPCLRLPSFPDVFRQFGVYFLYGLHMEGSGAGRLMKALCRFVHNLAKDDVGCGAVVAEVGQMDLAREVVPHWKKFSWNEDVWCIKILTDLNEDRKERHDPSDDNWIKSRPSSSAIFVDPRDF